MGQMDALIDLKERCDKYRETQGNLYVSQIDDSIGGKEGVLVPELEVLSVRCKHYVHLYLIC
jgi:hypothetical protein